ncbi:MAG TPA: TIGR03620 family F420-dependent LLM class oxidoreductase [Acidimicrobiales bacterium]|nr:TIGR03620 family F420-dependent LLM class oxidoreductase [Acidimicrobiales bacterium]
MSIDADIGRVGIWTGVLDRAPYAQGVEIANEIESLGYGAVWIPEAVGKDPLVACALLLAGTTKLAAATGIANIYARDPISMAQGHKTLTEAFPKRFVLGLGVSHRPMVEGMRGHAYEKPIATMRSYLEGMDAAMYLGAPPSTTPVRVLGALRDRMMGLSAELADGAHPYNVPPEHTAHARHLLGPGKLLAPEVAVTLERDATKARELGRAHLAIYMNLPNYTNNLRALGFADDDFADGGSDRLIDALVGWGGIDRVASMVRAHHDAGADHVCIQVLVPRGGTESPAVGWRELAPALLA